jgi:copper chaperone
MDGRGGFDKAGGRRDASRVCGAPAGGARREGVMKQRQTIKESERQRLEDEAIARQRFQVHGMTGSLCEQRIGRAIMALDPKAKVEANASCGHVNVSTPSEREEIRRAIVDAGYDVEA